MKWQNVGMFESIFLIKDQVPITAQNRKSYWTSRGEKEAAVYCGGLECLPLGSGGHDC